MKASNKKLIKKMEEKKYTVVRVNRHEFELDNGDVYPIPFELDDDISIEQFQKLLDESKEMVIDHIKKIDDKDGE